MKQRLSGSTSLSLPLRNFMNLKKIDFRQILEHSQILEDSHFEGFKVLGLHSTTTENPIEFYLAFLPPEEPNPQILFQLNRHTQTLSVLLSEDYIDCGTSAKKLDFEAFKKAALSKAPELVELLKKPPQKPFWVLIFQFFLIPLAIVILAVVLNLFFGIARQTQKSPEQLISTLAQKRGHARWQVAYELVQELEKTKGSLSPALVQQLLEIFQKEEKSAHRIRLFLIIALAYTQDPQVFPALQTALHEPIPPDFQPQESSSAEPDIIQEKIYILKALQILGTPSKRNPENNNPETPAPTLAPHLILAEIQKLFLLENLHNDIKEMALKTIGDLQDIRGIPLLKPLLTDKSPTLRMNAAVNLAFLGDPSGQDLLIQMLDGSFLKSIERMRPEQQINARISAISALEFLKIFPQKTLEHLRDHEKNLKIKNVVLKYFEKFATQSQEYHVLDS
jgi:hypothetical protein